MKENKIKKFFNTFHYYEWIYIILSYAIMISVSIYYHSKIFPLIVTLIGLTGVYGNLARKPFYFFTGFTFSVCYGIIALGQKYYGETAICFLYQAPMYLYAILKFLKNRGKEQTNTLTIHKLPKKYYLIWIPLIIAISVGYGFILKLIHTDHPFVNSIATAFCLAAIFCCTKPYKEQWIFWMLNSVVLILLWMFNLKTGTDNLPVFILNIIYLGINIYGCVVWELKYKKSLKKIEEE